jgi:hypothetical protein
MLQPRTPDCAAHDALQTRDRTKLRPRPFELGAVPDQRRTASCILTWEIVQRLVYALALRRIRDTAVPRHQFK